MRWLLPEQVMHTCNLECGCVYRVCIGIMSLKLELCDKFYKIVPLSRIYMLILRNVHWSSVSLNCLRNETKVLRVWLFNKCSHFRVSCSQDHYVFVFMAANLKTNTVTFFSHQHNSSTIPLSTPTLWSTPSPYIPVPPYQAWRTWILKNMSACYFEII